MATIITYSIFKTYKGIFTKKHAGNEHLLFVPAGDDFLILSLLGKFNNDDIATQQILRAPISSMNIILNEIKKSSEDFVIIEQVPCTVKSSTKGNYKVSLQKKGTNIASNLNISFEPEYSSGNIKIYSIKGKLMIVMGEDVNDSTQLKMAAMKKQAKLGGIFRRLLGR